MEVKLKSVEVSCCDDNFQLPVFEHFVEILIGNGYGLEEGHIGHVHSFFDKQLVEIDEFHFDDFNWFSTLGPFEVYEEHAVS